MEQITCRFLSFCP